jgi:hypothetical protein
MINISDDNKQTSDEQIKPLLQNFTTINSKQLNDVEEQQLVILIL